MYVVHISPEHELKEPKMPYLVGQDNGQAYESDTMPRTEGVDYVDQLIKGEWVNIFPGPRACEVCGTIHGAQRH